MYLCSWIAKEGNSDIYLKFGEKCTVTCIAVEEKPRVWHNWFSSYFLHKFRTCNYRKAATHGSTSSYNFAGWTELYELSSVWNWTDNFAFWRFRLPQYNFLGWHVVASGVWTAEIFCLPKLVQLWGTTVSGGVYSHKST